MYRCSNNPRHRGSNYNIPVTIWILDNHPRQAPLVYVCPTEDMQIRAGLHVDHTGKVCLPYLSDWSCVSSDLQGLIEVCIVTFSDRPPVFMKPAERNLEPNVGIPRGAGALAAASPMHSRNGGFQSNCKGNRKSLLIGINYFGQSGELRGCINDVNNVKKLIMSMGFPGSTAHMRVLTDETRKPDTRPTRKNIIEGIKWLLRDGQPNDSLFLHYSGHGGQTFDLDGDEEDGLDEFICPVDHKSAGMIVDDDLKALLSKKLPKGVRLTAVFDSCHSETALDLSFTYDCEGIIKRPMRSSSRSKNKAKGEKEQKRSIKGDVVMIAGCKDNQYSADGYNPGFGRSGACSYALVKALGCGGNPTYKDLLTTMRESLRSRYSQTIMLSTNFEMDMDMPFAI